MDLKHFLVTIFSGVVGTLAMTAVMYLYSGLSGYFTKVVHLLGCMLAGDPNQANPTKATLVLGTIAHFGVGILFSSAYFLLWSWGVFRVTFQDSVLIGCVSGFVAIGVWKIYFSLHQRPPALSHVHYFIALFIAHLVFGIVSVNTFLILAEAPHEWLGLNNQSTWIQSD